jgi:hypothetical protein
MGVSTSLTTRLAALAAGLAAVAAPALAATPGAIGPSTGGAAPAPRAGPVAASAPIRIVLLAAATNVPADASSADDARGLDALVAPLARYPDALLTLVLSASRQPQQVMAAARAPHRTEPDPNWDPAVTALASYPHVLARLADDPDRLRALGDAVGQRREALTAAVNRVRLAAVEAGTLRSTARRTVTVADGTVTIRRRDRHQPWTFQPGDYRLAPPPLPSIRDDRWLPDPRPRPGVRWRPRHHQLMLPPVHRPWRDPAWFLPHRRLYPDDPYLRWRYRDRERILRPQRARPMEPPTAHRPRTPPGAPASVPRSGPAAPMPPQSESVERRSAVPR